MIDQILMYITILLSVIAMGVIGWWVTNSLQYKHEVLIKINNKGLKQTQNMYAKQIKESDESYSWLLRTSKLAVRQYSIIPRPPNECIELTSKGNFFCAFFELDGGELKPIKSEVSFEESDLNFISKYEPTTVSQRQMIINQVEKSARQKGKSVSEVIMFAIPIVAIVLIISVFLLFFGEAVAPMIEMGDKYESIINSANNILDKADMIINDRIIFDSVETIGNNTHIIN